MYRAGSLEDKRLNQGKRAELAHTNDFGANKQWTI